MRLEARAQLLKRQLAVLVFVENLEPLVGGAQPLVEGDVGVEVVVGSGDRLRLANQLLDAPRRGSASTCGNYAKSTGDWIVSRLRAKSV